MNKEEMGLNFNEISKDMLHKLGYIEITKYRELQQENKQLKEELSDWDRIFDTFSKRKYAHRYLEERRKEDPYLLCPDSDEIYQKYYELKDNWNKLKEYLQERKKLGYSIRVKDLEPFIVISSVLDKMQELESGDNNG